MSSVTTMTTYDGLDSQIRDRHAAELLSHAAQNHTKPLWAQMSRLNPPLPNPKCEPHVWEYEKIRPDLLLAGDIITEKQAERRVLMLVNPSRGKAPSSWDVDS